MSRSEQPEMGIAMTERSTPKLSNAHPKRREFMTLVGGSMFTFGSAAAAWPLIDGLNPPAGADDATSVAMEISRLAARRWMKAPWQIESVIVFWRMEEQLATLEYPGQEHGGAVVDASIRLRRSPSYTNNWHRSIYPEIMVVSDRCPHDGYPLVTWADARFRSWLKEQEPFYCVHCDSRFDLAGRRTVGPSPDLLIPPYRFLSRDWIVIGEHPINYREET